MNKLNLYKDADKTTKHLRDIVGIEIGKVTMTNDLLFGSMCTYPEFGHRLFKSITKHDVVGKLDVRVQETHTSANTKQAVNSKDGDNLYSSVRMDVVLYNSNAIADVEIQQAKEKNMAKRVRTYASMLTDDWFNNHSKNHYDIPDLFVVVFYGFDIIPKNKCKEYKSVKIVRSYTEEMELLDDGLTYMFINYKSKESTGDDFLDSVCSALRDEMDSNNPYHKKFADIVRGLMSDERRREKIMTLQTKLDLLKEHFHQEGMEEGIQKGLEEGILIGAKAHAYNIALKYMRDSSKEKALSFAEISSEDFEILYEKYKGKPAPLN